MARSTERDKLYKAIGKGERTSKTVATIKKADGTSFRRRNANQYGNAEGGNDYTEKRANRTDFYPKDRRKKIMENGGKTPEEMAYEKEQNDYMFNSQFAKGSTIKMPNLEQRKKIVDSFSEEELKNWLAKNYGFRGVDGKGITKNKEDRSIINMRKEVLNQMDYVDKNIYAKGSTVKGKSKKKKVKEPMVVRGYFEDEAYEYGQGGKTNCWCYSIGGL